MASIKHFKKVNLQITVNVFLAFADKSFISFSIVPFYFCPHFSFKWDNLLVCQQTHKIIGRCSDNLKTFLFWGFVAVVVVVVAESGVRKFKH